MNAVGCEPVGPGCPERQATESLAACRAAEPDSLFPALTVPFPEAAHLPFLSV